ncbi:MAG: hypothetical protein ABEH65_10150 [Halobacteriales archaeon]
MCHHRDIEAWEVLREELDEADEIRNTESDTSEGDTSEPEIEAAEPVADD